MPEVRHRRLAPYYNDWLTLRTLAERRSVERELAARIDAAGYDLVVSSVVQAGPEVPAHAPDLLAFLATPSIYYCHEPPRRFYEPWCRPQAAPLDPYERARGLWRRPAHALVEAWVRRQDVLNVGRATLVVANSLYTCRRVRQVYGRSASVSYPGVRVERFVADPAAPRSTDVVSIGSLEPHKGFEVVVDAIGCMPEAGRPRLHVVGSGGHPNMPGRLEHRARQRRVELLLHTRLGDRALVDLLQTCSAFGFAARGEPFGLVILEALASGTPPAAIGEGGVPEIVQDDVNGRLVNRNAEALGEALATIVTDPARRRRLAAAGRHDAATRWDWPRAVERFEQLVVSAATGGRPG